MPTCIAREGVHTCVRGVTSSRMGVCMGLHTCAHTHAEGLGHADRHAYLTRGGPLVTDLRPPCLPFALFATTKEA